MKYVRLHLEEHLSVHQIEQEYGIGHALVSSWVKRYLQDGEDALEPRNGIPYAALHGFSLTIWLISAAKLPVFAQKQGNANTVHQVKKA